MKPWIPAATLVAALAATLIPATRAASTEPQAFITRHCLDCHDADSAKGGLDLSALPPDDGDPKLHQRWVRIHDRVAAGEMPPPPKRQPPANERSTFLQTLATDLSASHAARKGTALRRLNRREYENTVNQLLGIRANLADLLPEDGRAQGFDTIGEALHLSGVQLQRYMEAAEFALKVALQTEPKPETRRERYTLVSDKTRAYIGKAWLLRPDGAVVVFNDLNFPSTQFPGFNATVHGRYKVRITAYGYQIQRPPVFALISGTFERGGEQQIQGFFEVPPESAATVETVVDLRPGDALKVRPLGLGGPDGHSPIKDGPDRYPGEGLAILHADIEGPLLDAWPPRGRRILLPNATLREVPPKQPWLRRRRDYQPRFTADTPNPAADARRALGEFVADAFRRPVSPADVAPFIALFDREFAESRDNLGAITAAAVAVLCSPDFLFLHEPQGLLDNHALASRLAYFLTRTAPDTELLRVAAEGILTRPDVLRTQTERLLSGPGFDRFITDFTDGWLNLRDIEFTTPDRNLYPEFDDLLLDSMLRETRGFVRELFVANLGVDQVIRSDFAMLNARLAQHYGIPGVQGLDIRRVPLPPGSRRGGILTHASVLKVSANGTTTSPVIRGAWVLERILGITPQPPPPGTPGVEPDTRGATTLRELLAKHRSSESCNTCHRTINPPGFALENYDVIGGWRERFRTMGQGQQVRLRIAGRNVRYRLGPPVDASGQSPSGEPFRNFAEYQTLLLASRDTVARAITTKLLAFGSGREMGFSDRAEIDRLVADSARRSHTLRDLLHDIIQSPVFRRK